MAIACTSEDGNQAVVLITNLETGDSLSPCPDCLSSTLQMLLEVATGRPWEAGPEAATQPGPDDHDDDDEHQDQVHRAPPDPADSPILAPADVPPADPPLTPAEVDDLEAGTRDPDTDPQYRGSADYEMAAALAADTADQAGGAS